MCSRVQDEIARAIVDKLTEKLGGHAAGPLVKRPTDDLDAYNLYLQGRYYWARRGGFLRKAVECFEQAIARDPAYAHAYAGLADAYGVLGIYGLITPAEAASKAKPAAARAVALDDTLAEAHRSMAAYRVSFEWDLIGAEREYRRALELGANSAEVYAIYGYCLAYLRRVDESLAAIQRARTLEPESVLVASYCAVNLMFAHRYDEALAECERCLCARSRVCDGGVDPQPRAHADREARVGDRSGGTLGGADQPSEFLAGRARDRVCGGRTPHRRRSDRAGTDGPLPNRVRVAALVRGHRHAARRSRPCARVARARVRQPDPRTDLPGRQSAL